MTTSGGIRNDDNGAGNNIDNDEQHDVVDFAGMRAGPVFVAVRDGENILLHRPHKQQRDHDRTGHDPDAEDRLLGV